MDRLTSNFYCCSLIARYRIDVGNVEKIDLLWNPIPIKSSDKYEYGSFLRFPSYDDSKHNKDLDRKKS